MAIRHANPGETIDLSPLGPALKHARTTAIVKSDAFEAVRLVVRAGADIKTHRVDGPITLHCLEGRALLGLPATSVELLAGQWLYLDGGEPHSVKGIEDSALLLTILFPTQTGRRNRDKDMTADDPAAEIPDSLLDEGLLETFPASDPVSVSNPSTGIKISSRGAGEKIKSGGNDA